MIDLINSFPNIGNIVDSLCPEGLAGFRNSPVKDTLSNQMDCIEACMTSLNSKMAVLDKVDDNEVRTLPNAVLVALDRAAIFRGLCEVCSELDVGQPAATRRQSNAGTTAGSCPRAKEAIRQPALFPLATAAGLCPLSSCHRGLHRTPCVHRAVIDGITHRLGLCSTPFHILLFLKLYVFMWLVPCAKMVCLGHGDERGMIEDMNEIWTAFPSRVMFRFMAASSSVSAREDRTKRHLHFQVSQTCVPHLTGTRTQIQVTIPLLPSGQEKLPPKLAAGEWFHVRTVFWNIGRPLLETSTKDCCL